LLQRLIVGGLLTSGLLTGGGAATAHGLHGLAGDGHDLAGDGGDLGCDVLDGAEDTAWRSSPLRRGGGGGL
jgi:hypothetical protein